MLPNFSYLRPDTIEHAANAAAEPGSRVMGGGTDLLGCLREGILPVERIVSLGGLSDLTRVRRLPAGLSLGAGLSVADLARDPDLARRYPLLAQAASVVASPQLRNQGTLGGNLCQKPRCWYYRGDFPCVRRGGDFCSAMDGQNHFHAVLGGDACVYVHPSDLAPALTALDATLVITAAGGDRTVSMGDFYVLPAEDPTRETMLRPGEFVSQVRLPDPEPGSRSSYRKVRSRGSWDFALVSTALLLLLDGGRVRDARVVLGGVAPAPWRAVAAEEALKGRTLDAQVAATAATAALAGAEPLAHNAAKVEMCRRVLETELLKLAG